MTTSTPDPEGATAEPLEGPLLGWGIVRSDAVGTGALLVATVAASVAESNATDLLNLAVSGVLFVGGCVAFALGFVRAAGRSRTEVVDLAGLFYLTGSAPQQVRRILLGLWFAQIAIATVSVITVQPPFGVMAPVWGIGILTLWSSRHATFPPRAP
jgi:hypothetical protein